MDANEKKETLWQTRPLAHPQSHFARHFSHNIDFPPNAPKSENAERINSKHVHIFVCFSLMFRSFHFVPTHSIARTEARASESREGEQRREIECIISYRKSHWWILNLIKWPLTHSTLLRTSTVPCAYYCMYQWRQRNIKKGEALEKDVTFGVDKVDKVPKGSANIISFHPTILFDVHAIFCQQGDTPATIWNEAKCNFLTIIQLLRWPEAVCFFFIFHFARCFGCRRSCSCSYNTICNPNYEKNCFYLVHF